MLPRLREALRKDMSSLALIERMIREQAALAPVGLIVANPELRRVGVRQPKIGCYELNCTVLDTPRAFTHASE